MKFLKLSERYAPHILVGIVLAVVVFHPPWQFYAGTTALLLASMFTDNYLYRRHLFRIKKVILDWAFTQHVHSSIEERLPTQLEGLMARNEDIVRVILEGGIPFDAHVISLLRIAAGESPVPEEHRGKIELMAQYWREWGRERGYHPCALQL